MLAFESLEKRYPDGTVALAGISFTVPKGQLCVILGPSGAGKSTLLRCVNGLVRPSAGRVCIDGVPVDPQSLRDIRPSVGMIHQNFNLVGRSSVATNVIAGALPRVATLPALFGIFPQSYRRKACELVEDVGLSELHLRRRVSELSGGQQQRVGIARAFMLNPQIVLADEPVASLDPQTSADILALLAREARMRGATVLCSLHQIELATAFADRIVAMRAGRLAFDGPPQSLTPEVIESIYGAANIAKFPGFQPFGSAAVTLSVVEPMNRTTPDWRFPKPFGWRSALAAVAVFVLLIVTGHRVEMDKAAILTGQAIATAAGMEGQSQVAAGLSSVVSKLFPLQIDERTDASRIENFDPNHLPFLAHIETEENKTQTLNPQTFQLDTVVQRKQVLVRRFGYVLTVVWKLVETIEIALWGTVVAILVGLPLAFLGARNLTTNRWINFASRAVVSLFRAVPELISALFLVLAYGFGPIAGVLALAIHSTGFLGKFYAEDIENADPKAQEALEAIGANRLKLFRFAILPQVMPQYIAYTLYILDRNVRMATVIGLVGAGGIGQELKGRYDLFNYGHVGTILAAIFLLVLALDQIAVRLRRAYL